MKTTTTCTLKKITILSFISATVIYAFTEHHFSFIENKPETLHTDSYQYMSTTQLEKEVEQHSLNGELPFDMGLELIKRWKNK